MPKIIFLDFDGPMIPMRIWMLNPLGRCHASRVNGATIEKFDPIAVEFLLYILKHSDTKLVISSSWREGGYDFIVEVLEYSGIDRKHLHEDWQTKDLVHHSLADRPVEIKEWLTRHPEITTYIAIDDAKMDIPNLIHASCNDGLSFDNQLEALRILGVRYAI